MKPVQQTLEYPKGDCFAACVASILEVPLESLPNYHGYNWFNRWNEFLYRTYRSTLLYWEDDLPSVKQLAWWIAEIPSPRRPEIMHSVVFYQDEFRWDPFPDVDYKYTVSDSKSIIAIYSIGSIIDSEQSPESFDPQTHPSV